MPFLIPILGVATAFFAGAFAGSQVDDAVDHPAAASPTLVWPSTERILIYGAAGVALWLAAKKFRLVK